jgi:hypothetical protein
MFENPRSRHAGEATGPPRRCALRRRPSNRDLPVAAPPSRLTRHRGDAHHLGGDMPGRPSGGSCRQACRDSGWPAAQAQRIHSRMSAAVARKFSMSGGGAGGGCGGLGRPLPVHMAGLLAAGCTGRGRAHRGVCAGVWSSTIGIDRAADRVPPFGGLRRTAVTGRYARREFSPRPIAPLTFLSTAPDGRNKTT